MVGVVSIARGYFQVGDRVVYTGVEAWNDNIKAGDTGEVCAVDISNSDPDWAIISVRWDKYVAGHDCDGNCDSGFGWNVSSDDIELQQPDMIPDADEVDAFLRDMWA